MRSSANGDVPPLWAAGFELREHLDTVQEATSAISGVENGIGRVLRDTGAG